MIGSVHDTRWVEWLVYGFYYTRVGYRSVLCSGCSDTGSKKEKAVRIKSWADRELICKTGPTKEFEWAEWCPHNKTKWLYSVEEVPH